VKLLAADVGKLAGDLLVAAVAVHLRANVLATGRSIAIVMIGRIKGDEADGTEEPKNRYGSTTSRGNDVEVHGQPRGHHSQLKS